MAVRDLRRRLTAGEVMTSDVSTVSPETPVRQVGEFTLAKGSRAVPVVGTAVQAVGIMTNSNRRAGDVRETAGGGYGFVLATARAGPRFPVASPPQGGRTHLVQPLR